MSSPHTEELLQRLARGAQPVRPLPRIRTALLGVAVAWMLSVALYGLFGGSLGALLSDVPWNRAGFTGAFLGLAVAALGGTLRALAGAVPGRERVAEVGRVLAAVGLGVAAIAGIFSAAGAGLGARLPLEAHLTCISRATALGLLSAVVVVSFVAYGYAPRLLLGVCFAIGGAVALGGLVVHLGCRVEGFLHLLLGHSLAPVFAVLVLALPLTALARRISRRDPPA